MRSSPISLPSAKEWTCACVVVTDRRMLAASAATAAAAAKSASVLNNCLPTASFPSIPFYFFATPRSTFSPSVPRPHSLYTYAASTDSNFALLNCPFLLYNTFVTTYIANRLLRRMRKNSVACMTAVLVFVRLTFFPHSSVSTYAHACICDARHAHVPGSGRIA